MSGKRFRGPDLLPPRVKRRTILATDQPTPTNSFLANASAQQISSQPAQRSGLEYIELFDSNQSVVFEMLSGLQHDPNRSDLFIGVALLLKRNASVFQGDQAVQHFVQFLVNPGMPSHLLQLVAEVIHYAFPNELPFQFYKLYIDSLIEDSTTSKWISRAELEPFVSRLRLLSGPPNPTSTTDAPADDEEELIQESGSVSAAMQSATLQQQVGAYVMSKVNASPTPNLRSFSLLSAACGLAECRQGAIRLLSGISLSDTLSGKAVELVSKLCLWVSSHADFTLLYGLLSLPIAAKALGAVVSDPRYWQAALSFLFSQDKITVSSQPDIFHTVFSQKDLVEKLLPNFCLRYLSTTAEARSTIRLRSVLVWALCNPAASPYLKFPDFPLSLLSAAEPNNFPVIRLASYLGNVRSGLEAADFHLESVRLLNRRFTDGTISGDLALVVQVLLSQNPQNSPNVDVSYPLHCDTIVHILSLSLIHHLLDSMSAFSILETAVTRALSQPISTSCGPDDSRSICEAIMQLSIVSESGSVQTSLYWNSVTLLVLLSSLCPGSIGVFAYNRIATVRDLLNAIMTNDWEPVLTISDSVLPETFPLDLSSSQPVPDSIALNLRQLVNTYCLSDKIISHDTQFQLVALLSDLQSPDVLCSWLLPVLNETATRRETVPLVVLAHLLLFLGAQSPHFCIERIQSCLSSYDRDPAAAAVLLKLLKGLSSDDFEVRQRARTALQIAFRYALKEPFAFLGHPSVVELGVNAIRSAIQAESSPSIIGQYVKFLIGHYERQRSVDEGLVRFLYDNVFLRSHIARTLLSDHATESGLHQVVQSVVSDQFSSDLDFLLDVRVLVVSHNGVPVELVPEYRRLIRPEILSSRHIDLLLDGATIFEFQRIAITVASAEQVCRFAKGFGRSPTLISACRARLQALGVCDTEPVDVPIQAQEPGLNPPCPHAGFSSMKLEDAVTLSSSVPDVQRLLPAQPDRVPIRKLDLNDSNFEVVTPRFHPEFRTIKHRQTRKSSPSLNCSKDRLLHLWSTGMYDELVAELRNLRAWTET